MSKFGDKIICNPIVKLQKGEKYPLIDIEKINAGYKFINTNEHIEYGGQSSVKFEDGDVLMARITPCLENRKFGVAQTAGQKGIGSTELFVFRGKEHETTTDYVYYLLCMKHIRQLAANSMTGASGRQRADIEFIKRIDWQFPEIEIQQKITSILSNYDDLIENNKKRINILEQIAENLYKEWFVRFRFPGHESCEFENDVPKNWQIKRIEDFGKVKTGKTPSTSRSEYYDGDILFVKTPDMHDKTFVINTEETLSTAGNNSQKNCLLPPNSIMVSCIGTGGVVSINAFPAHTNQQINSIVLHKKQDLEWLYFCLKSMKETIIMFGNTGSTMTNLSKGKFARLKILCPNQQVIAEFNKFAAPLFNQVLELSKLNRNLIKQRDLLLPRLMSGKLEV